MLATSAINSQFRAGEAERKSSGVTVDVGPRIGSAPEPRRSSASSGPARAPGQGWFLAVQRHGDRWPRDVDTQRARRRRSAVRRRGDVVAPRVAGRPRHSSFNWPRSAAAIPRQGHEQSAARRRRWVRGATGTRPAGARIAQGPADSLVSQTTRWYEALLQRLRAACPRDSRTRSRTRALSRSTSNKGQPFKLTALRSRAPRRRICFPGEMPSVARDRQCGSRLIPAGRGAPPTRAPRYAS
jgi:hypothetical protein